MLLSGVAPVLVSTTLTVKNNLVVSKIVVWRIANAPWLPFHMPLLIPPEFTYPKFVPASVPVKPVVGSPNELYDGMYASDSLPFTFIAQPSCGVPGR